MLPLTVETREDMEREGKGEKRKALATVDVAKEEAVIVIKPYYQFIRTGTTVNFNAKRARFATQIINHTRNTNSFAHTAG